MSNKNGKLKIGSDNFYPAPYWPLHSIYLSFDSTNPSTYFGGTWELVGKGKTLVGVDTNDSDFNVVRKTGGEKRHTLSVNEMPSHNHNINFDQIWSFGGTISIATTSGGPYGGSGYIANAGGGQAHNNLQPYLTCYIWERIA